MPFDAVVIREALQRERFRGGQVFCVVPRIEDLPRMAERLAEIVPEARMAQAHGRLAPTELERVMTEFGDGGTTSCCPPTSSRAAWTCRRSIRW